jgi:hypothetical protein
VRKIDTYRGDGTVTPAGGQSVSVHYKLDVWQEDNPDGRGGTMPGKQSIRGTITPFCGTPREKLTLRMSDGKSVEFFFTDLTGTATATGGITGG